MGKPVLKVVAHLELDEVRKRIAASDDELEKVRWEIILRKSQGEPTASIAEAVGCKTDHVRRTTRRYNEGGPEGIASRNRGIRRHTSFDPEQLRQLSTALEGSPPGGGLWSGPKVALWAQLTHGIEMSRTTGWAWLRRLGWTHQVPRPFHAKANKEAQEAFKKGG